LGPSGLEQMEKPPISLGLEGTGKKSTHCPGRKEKELAGSSNWTTKRRTLGVSLDTETIRASDNIFFCSAGARSSAGTHFFLKKLQFHQLPATRHRPDGRLSAVRKKTLQICYVASPWIMKVWSTTKTANSTNRRCAKWSVSRTLRRPGCSPPVTCWK
jgi:hypothetical protein